MGLGSPYAAMRERRSAPVSGKQCYQDIRVRRQCQTILGNAGLPKGGTTIAQPFNFKVGSERARSHAVPKGTADSVTEVPYVVLDAMFEAALSRIQPSLRD